jgi:hypothetical protein
MIIIFHQLVYLMKLVANSSSTFLVNLLMARDDIELNLELYKAKVKKNINLLFLDFIGIFTNFDLKFKTFYDIKLKKKLIQI